MGNHLQHIHTSDFLVFRENADERRHMLPVESCRFRASAAGAKGESKALKSTVKYALALESSSTLAIRTFSGACDVLYRKCSSGKPPKFSAGIDG